MGTYLSTKSPSLQALDWAAVEEREEEGGVEEEDDDCLVNFHIIIT